MGSEDTNWTGSVSLLGYRADYVWTTSESEGVLTLKLSPLSLSDAKSVVSALLEAEGQTQDDTDDSQLGLPFTGVVP